MKTSKKVRQHAISLAVAYDAMHQAIADRQDQRAWLWAISLIEHAEALGIDSRELSSLNIAREVVSDHDRKRAA